MPIGPPALGAAGDGPDAIVEITWLTFSVAASWAAELARRQPALSPSAGRGLLRATPGGRLSDGAAAVMVAAARCDRSAAVAPPPRLPAKRGPRMMSTIACVRAVESWRQGLGPQAAGISHASRASDRM